MKRSKQQTLLPRIPPPSTPSPVHSCLSCHPSLLRVGSFTDCMLTESTALIAVSSSYFIIFCRPGSEGNTSRAFCRVGGQAACWVPPLDCPPSADTGAASTRLRVCPSACMTQRLFFFCKIGKQTLRCRGSRTHLLYCKYRIL